jgi:hypothetical protein
MKRHSYFFYSYLIISPFMFCPELVLYECIHGFWTLEHLLCNYLFIDQFCTKILRTCTTLTLELSLGGM